MRTKLTLSICLIITLSIVSCGKKEEEIVLSPLERAQMLMAQYKFAAADSAFAEQELAQPEMPWGRYGEALAQERQWLFWDALPAYYKITERNPGFRPAEEGKARIIRQLGYPADAALLRQRAIDSGSTDALAFYDLARDLLLAEEFSLARATIDKATAAGLDAGSAAFELGAALAGHQKRDSAIQFANVALESPDTTTIYFQSAADYYESIGQIDSSMIWSRRVFTAPGATYDNRIAHFRRALRLGYHYDARRFINDEVERGANDSIRTVMELFYDMARGAYAAATEDNDLLCFYKVSWSTCNAFLLWTHPKAMDVLTPGEIRSELYATLMSSDQAPEFNKFAYYYFEMLVNDWLADIGRDPEFDKIEGEYAERPDVTMAKLHTLRATGDFAKYDKQFERVTKEHAKEPDWLERFGIHFSHRSVKRWAKVEEYYKKALELDSYDYSVFVRLVEVYRYLQRWDDALALYDKYPQFLQLYPEESVRRSLCFIEKKEYGVGVEAFEKGIPLLRGDLSYFYQAFDQYKLDYQLERARSLAELCVSLSGDNADAYQFAAKVCAWLDDYKQAYEYAKKATELDPTWVNGRVQLARAMYGMGDKEGAVKIFEEILANDREQLDANYYYSRLLAMDQIDMAKAQNMARIAASNSIFAYDEWLNLIYVYQQAGRYDLMRGEAIKASRKFQVKPLPYYYLGVAYFNSGQLDKVKEPLEAAIKFGLTGPYLEDAKDILSKV